MEQKDIRKKIEFYTELTIKLNFTNPYSIFPEKSVLLPPEKIGKYWTLYLENKKDLLLSLYVHVPYCYRKKCRYCMYESKPISSRKDIDGYLDYVSESADFYRPIFEGHPFTTMFVGGGTPTLLREDQLERLVRETKRGLSFKDNGTRTIEIKPSLYTNRQIEIAREYDFNRISIGVQSMNRRVMRLANRDYVEAERIRDLVRFIRELEFKEVNIDLMAGLPGDTPRGFLDTFREIASMGVSTITVYIFRPVKTTGYTEKQKSESAAAFMKDLSARLLEMVAPAAVEFNYTDRVRNPGFDRQKFFHESFDDSLVQHYTTCEPMVGNSLLGIGVKAASFILDHANFIDLGPFGLCRAGIREALSDNMKFSTSLFHTSIRSETDRMRDFVIKELYRRNEVDTDDFRRLFARDILDVFGEEISCLESLGKMEVEPGRIRLLSDGLLDQGIHLKFFYDQEYLENLIRK